MIYTFSNSSEGFSYTQDPSSNYAPPQDVVHKYKFFQLDPYLFTQDDYNPIPPSIVVKLRSRTCIQSTNGVFRVKKSCSIVKPVLNLDYHTCSLVSSSDNHISNKLVTFTYQFKATNKHYCYNVNAGTGINYKLLSIVPNYVPLPPDHKCFTNTYSKITRYGKVAQNQAHTDFLNIKYRINVNSPAGIEIIDFIYKEVVTDGDFDNVYRFTNRADDATFSYGITAENYTFNDTLNYTFGFKPNTVISKSTPSDLKYPFVGKLNLTHIREVRSDGLIRKGMCFRSRKPVNTLKHLCYLIKNGIKPKKGKSTIINNTYEPPTKPPIIQMTIPNKAHYETSLDPVITIGEGVNAVDITSDVESLNINISSESHSFEYSIVGYDSLLSKISKLDIITIDLGYADYLFKMIVENIRTNHTFNNVAVSVSGRGLTAEMSSPMMIPVTANFAAATNVSQIIESQLGLGWTLSYQQFDWVIPSNTYSIENKSTMATILDICSKTGSVCVPHPNLKQLTIKPRYPTLPWLYSDANNEVFIPSTSVFSYSTSESVGGGANAIFIHGTTENGIVSKATKNLTAGDKVAVTASNELMTDINGVRALANRILSAEQEISPIETITFYGLRDIPLILPSTRIKIDGIHATTNSFSLQLAHGEISITLGIGEFTNNSFSTLLDIIPQSPLTIVRILNTDGKKSIVTTVAGSGMVVLGTGAINGYYFVKGGSIVGQAPALSEIDISI